METGYAVEKITDGLLKLMNEMPFEKITVSDIVLEAGVGRASFYRHFDSKEAVIRSHWKARRIRAEFTAALLWA